MIASFKYEIIITESIKYFPVRIAFLVHETSSEADPRKLVGAEKHDGELADAVSQSLDVVRDVRRMQHSGRPPSIRPQLDPEDFAEQRSPTVLAVRAKEGAVRRVDFEAVRVKAGGTHFAADQGAA